MTNYQCEGCGEVFEIEEAEVVLSPPEHYEHGMCRGCFEEACK